MALSEVLDTVGLTGEVSDVEVSNESLFSAKKCKTSANGTTPEKDEDGRAIEDENGTWFVFAHKAFSTEEWMKVTIGGMQYEIMVTDTDLSGFLDCSSGSATGYFTYSNHFYKAEWSGINASKTTSVKLIATSYYNLKAQSNEQNDYVITLYSGENSTDWTTSNITSLTPGQKSSGYTTYDDLASGANTSVPVVYKKVCTVTCLSANTPTWAWSADYSSCTVTFTCAENTSLTTTVNATVTTSGDVRTASVTFNSTNYQDSKTYCTVTFNSNGGPAVASQSMLAGETVSKPADPTRDDCRFEGWYSNEGLTTPYNFSAEVNASFTLYAKWKTLYTVTWCNYDGTTLKSDQVAEGETPVYDGTTPTKLSDAQYFYTFSGWTPAVSAVTGNATYTADYNKTPVPGGSTTATGNWSDYKAASLTESADYETIYISTAEELALYAWNVNEDNRNSKGYYCARTVELQADIDLSAHYWIPIGKDSTIYFNGKFHGNGHTITGLTVQDVSGFDGAGLIGYLQVASSGTSGVTNLTIKDCNVRAASTEYVGAIVGRYNYEDRNVITGCFVVNGLVEGKTIEQTGCIAGQFDNYVNSMSNNYYADCHVYAGGAARSVNCGVGSQDRTGVTPLFTITADDGITIDATPTKTYGDMNYYAKGTDVTIGGAVGYVVKDSERNDITSSVLSGSTLTMPEKNVVISKKETGSVTYGVSITSETGMTKTSDSGLPNQTGLSGAMTNVVYTADEGYYFPTDYSVEPVNGISVTRDSYTQITVSGTPTADASITLTAPTAKTTPDAPTTAEVVNCTTAANNDGKLTGVTEAMEYKKSDAEGWTDGTGNDITGLAPGTYYVRVKATDTANASANQELTIEGFTAPTHTHSFTYSASGATITATCTAEGCTLPPSTQGGNDHVATLTIAATGGTYDGTTSFGATITDEHSIQGEAKVQYQKKTDGSYETATETAPINAGDYKASITLGTGDNAATTSVEYTIAKAAGSISYTITELTKTFGDAAFTNELTKTGDGTVSYGSSDTGVAAVNSDTGEVTIAGVGQATITATVTDSDNYTNATKTASYTLTVSPATMTVSASGYTGTYNSQPHSITVTVTTPSTGATIAYGTTEGTYDLTTNPAITNVSDSKTVYFKVTAPNYSDYTGSAAVALSKADQTAPGAPTMESATINSITLKAITNGQYNLGDGEWKDDPIFTGLTMNTEYTFHQRLKGDDNHNASPASQAANISTNNHVHEWSYQANGATITATCGNTDGGHGTPLTATMTINAPARTVYGGSESAEATITGSIEGVTTPSIVYKKGSDTLDAAPTNAGTYTANITLGEGEGAKTAYVEYTIGPMALTITGATAAARAYDKDSTAVTISSVTFKDSSDQAVALTLGEDKDYTVTGTMTDANAGDGKTVNVTVTLKNANYNLATSTTTATVNIGKAAAQTIADVTDSQVYTLTSISKSVADKMPADAGELTYTKGNASTTGSVTVSVFAVNESGTVTATLSGGAAGDTVTLPVTISSTNYADSSVNVKITLTAKGTQNIDAADVTATYGDTDKKISATTDGDGAISYAVKDGSADYIDVNASTGALTIKKVPADGKAYVVVTAAGTAAYEQATKDVTVTINKANAVPAAVTANNRTYDGTEKPLMTVTGEATGGTMQYALGTATEATEPYTTSIPTATNAGIYCVWYYVKGDDKHVDTEPECIEVTISSYAYISGDGSTWTKNSVLPLIFRIRNFVNDSKTSENFTGIQVDGKPVSKEQYKAYSGSVIIELKPTYLETLSAGEHKLTAGFTDGTADAKFTILASEVVNLPQTGDGSNVSGHMFAGLIALAGLGLLMKKRS